MAGLTLFSLARKSKKSNNSTYCKKCKLTIAFYIDLLIGSYLLFITLSISYSFMMNKNAIFMLSFE